MSDLKTFWQSGSFTANESTPGMPIETDLSGTVGSSRGGDPLFPDGQKESSNSVSGLPALPTRFVSTEKPPDPPTLEDRNPGTIDEK